MRNPFQTWLVNSTEIDVDNPTNIYKIDNIATVFTVDLGVNKTLSTTSEESVMKSHMSLQFIIMVPTMQATSKSQKGFSEYVSLVSSTASCGEYDSTDGILSIENNETLTVKIMASETTPVMTNTFLQMLSAASR